jgi:hypothetical protein
MTRRIAVSRVASSSFIARIVATGLPGRSLA